MEDLTAFSPRPWRGRGQREGWRVVAGNEGGRAGQPGSPLRGTAAGILLFGCDELDMLFF